MLKSSLKRVRKQVSSWIGKTAVNDGSIGAIDALEGFVLKGWFIAKDPTGAPNRFAAFVDEHSLGTFDAVLPRPDVLVAEGVLECGFAVNLEALLRALPGGLFTASDSAPHRFTLRTPKGRVVAEKTITPSENDTSTGVIDALEGFILRGWFISRHPQVTSNRFAIAIDDQSLGTFDAMLPRPDLLAAEGMLNCGFSVDLEPALLALPRGIYALNDGAPHNFSLRTVGGRVVGEKVLVGASPFRGFFDELHPNGISGWAIDESRPDMPVEVSVLVDGVPFLDATTSQLRRDLIAEGIAGQQAGFTLSWPRGLLHPGTVVDVRHKTTGESLVDSPRTVDEQGSSPARANLGYLDAARTGQLKAVTVVVPVHNAFEAVSECLASVARLTGANAEILVIDDGSTDPRIAALLASYAARPRFRVERNTEALGYTRTINKAIAICNHRDVVLLNSDTVVTERWLECLRYGAYAFPRVATVTALSDNAGAFSCPVFGSPNPLPPHLTREAYARLLTNQADGRLPEVPTGNGFCMYIRRTALDAIGMFDEQKYPRGYGEENDFCMRALRRGWKSLICDKAYVFHKRAQSFQGEKQPLLEAGMAQVHADYPEYKLLTGRFNDAELGYVRLRARVALTNDEGEGALPRLMYVVSTQTGGTPQTNLDLMRSMRGRYHCFLLRCDAELITLSELVGDELVVRETYPLSVPIDPVTHRSDEYDRVVLDMLYRHSIVALHIRHIAWHSMGLAEAAKSLGIPVVYSSHDFYALCPSLNLLDDELRYCAGVCTQSDGICQVVLWPPSRLPALKDRFIHRWRDMFRELFRDCDSIVLASRSAAEIFLGVFPECRDKIALIPHGRDFAELRSAVRHPMPDAKIRVVVPGNISASKGSELIREIHRLDTKKRLELHFLGNVAKTLSTIGVRHGTYDRAQFASKLDAIGPHVGVVLSIWPETFCHTLTELWSCGIPVVAIDLGAVGDRIRETGGGWLVPPTASPAEVLEAIKAAVDDVQGFDERVQAVRRWQLTEGRWSDTATMSVEYRRVYARLLAPDATQATVGARTATDDSARVHALDDSARAHALDDSARAHALDDSARAHALDDSAGALAPSESSLALPARIGLLVKGRGASHPATSYIRLLRPMRAAIDPLELDVRPVAASWLDAGGIDHVDSLVIQRDALPASQTASLLEGLAVRGIPYAYEIDDRLWAIPDDHWDHRIGAEQQQAIRALIEHAHVVTTSTEPLAAELRAWNPNVVVIPNELDPSVWLAPIRSDYADRIVQECGLADDVPRILYMGTRCHAPDLDMIVPAVEQVAAAARNVQVIQVRGGSLLPGARKITVPDECAEYPDFVRWFRVIASRATLALAPLRQTPFNAVKSDIKILDYALGRVPAIFSAVPPYLGAVSPSETGLLCNNDVAAWRDAIMLLLTNASLRETVRERAYERALTRTLGHSGAHPWREVLVDLANARRSRAARPSP